ncbi:MAG TPA: cytochrome C oxidase subunit IV family protein [Gammaproteobacteria bacterium]
MKVKRLKLDTASGSYLLLLFFTLLTFLAGESGSAGLQLSLMVLCMALLKGHLVGDHFMGLARVRGLWRWVVLLWLVFPALLIGTAFLLAAR